MTPVTLSLAVTLLCLSAGCTQHTTIVPADTVHWHIALSVTPRQPRQLDPVQFQVQVKDTNQKPVPGAAVTIRLAMPAMDMGRNEVKLHEMTPLGTYAGSGRFTMPGDWQITATADKGAAHQSQTFPVTVH